MFTGYRGSGLDFEQVIDVFLERCWLSQLLEADGVLPFPRPAKVLAPGAQFRQECAEAMHGPAVRCRLGALLLARAFGGRP